MDSKLYVIENVANHLFQSNDFYVYMLIHPVTNLPFYVGKGRDSRGWKHILLRNNPKVSNANPHLYNTIRKIINDCQQVIVRIVKTFSTEADAFVHEQSLIKQIGRSCDGAGTLTNITRGGEGNTSNGKAIDQYSMFGEYVGTYSNAKEAARINGWPYYTTISACCTGRERSYKGYLWCYSGEQPTTPTKIRPIYQWTLTGQFVSRYKSISEAANKIECDPSTIRDCLNGHIRAACGYMWSYNDTPPTLRPDRKKRQVIHRNTGLTYDSVTLAAKATNHNIGHVSACCNGKRESIGGDRFSYVT